MGMRTTLMVLCVALAVRCDCNEPYYGAPPPSGPCDEPVAHGQLVGQKPDCTLTCDEGFLNCNDNDNDGCETSQNSSDAGPNTIIVPLWGSWGGGCTTACAKGFSDCDGNKKNGCETT